MTPDKLSYKDAGVDIDAGDALVARIGPLARRTPQAGVLAGIGGFGALYELPEGLRRPVLVSGTDGVGTKLKLAFALDRHDTIGIDLVAMSVNDILVQGARPLYFLDYFACGRLDVDRAARVVGGIARGCELSGCALIGGETAEMPGMYPDGEYDLAGFAVGVVDRHRIIDGTRIAPGDVVLGLASSGPHSNGYSLIRRVVDRALGPGASLDVTGWDGSGRPAGSQPGGERGVSTVGITLADALMAPTRLYVRSLLPLFGTGDEPTMIKGLAHITGGGLVENVPRILPEGVAAELDAGAWTMPSVFRWLQREGAIDDAEMHRVFNCGIGMVVVVAESDAGACEKALRDAGEQVARIGRIVPRAAGAPATVVV